MSASNILDLPSGVARLDPNGKMVYIKEDGVVIRDIGAMMGL